MQSPAGRSAFLAMGKKTVVDNMHLQTCWNKQR